MARAARPTKYRGALCGEVVACLAEGKSLTAFAGRIGVTRSTLRQWAAEQPDFAEAIEVGEAKAAEFWEDILIKIARDGGGNATAAIFALKSRAPAEWRDRPDPEAARDTPADSPPADPRELAKAIVAALRKAAAEPV